MPRNNDSYTARLEALNGEGDNSLHVAVKNGYFGNGAGNVYQLMDLFEVNPFIRNKDSRSALDLLDTSKHNSKIFIEAEEKFLSKKLDDEKIARYKKEAEIPDELGNNALHKAAEIGNLREVKFLVEKLELDLDQKNKENKTPKDLATDEEIINYLEQKNKQLTQEKAKRIYKNLVNNKEITDLETILNSNSAKILEEDKLLEKDDDDDQTISNRIDASDPYSELMQELENITKEFEELTDKSIESGKVTYEELKEAFDNLPEELKNDLKNTYNPMEIAEEIEKELPTPSLSRSSSKSINSLKR